MFQYIKKDDENYRLQYVNKQLREVIEFDRKFNSPEDGNNWMCHIRNLLNKRSDTDLLQALRYNYTYSVKSIKT